MFPPAIIPMELQITVSEGLVAGVIAPITPKGPISTSVSPLSPDHAMVCKSSVPGVLSAVSLCLRILSPTLPIPVSLTPMLAMISAFSCVFLLMTEMIFSLWSRDIQRTTFCASMDALMASFIS